MIKSPIYSNIERVSRSEEFQQIQMILSSGYGDDFDKMNIVDKFMSMNLDDVYAIYRCCYQSLSYVWLTMGLRPNLNIGVNKGMENYDRIMKNMNKMPDDVINLISSFIPDSNYRDKSDMYFNSRHYSTCLFHIITVAPDDRIRRNI
jgi:hypothetical protein